MRKRGTKTAVLGVGLFFLWTVHALAGEAWYVRWNIDNRWNQGAAPYATKADCEESWPSVKEYVAAGGSREKGRDPYHPADSRDRNATLTIECVKLPIPAPPKYFTLWITYKDGSTVQVSKTMTEPGCQDAINYYEKNKQAKADAHIRVIWCTPHE